MNTYEIKQAEKKERLLERAAKNRERAAALYSLGSTALQQIPFGQPILIGHHSERADRSYRGRAIARIGKSFEMADTATALEDRAENMGNQISSDDPDAVKKLKEKLSGRISMQNRMKAENSAARKEGKEKPFAAYQLSNNNANIKSIETRIKQLEARKTEIPRTKTGVGYSMVEDLEDNRINFKFDGKPSEEIRNLLKSFGFKWSPSRSTWTRKFSSNARYSTNRLCLEIEKQTPMINYPTGPIPGFND